MDRKQIEKMEAGPELDALVSMRIFGAIPFEGPEPFSTSIEAAWEVGERVAEMLSTPGPMGGSRRATFGFYHSRVRQIGYDYKYYQAYFKPPKGPAFSSLGDTMPLAICRAALLAA